MTRVGIVGFGKIGRIRSKYLSEIPSVEIVGVCDPKLEKDCSLEYKIFESIDDLFEIPMDAVFLCTTNDLLSEYTMLALRSGINVFCEKPPAQNTKQLMKVSAVYEETNLVLKYGFNHRYHYSVIEAKKLIESGEYGKILWMRGVYGKAGSIDYHENWRNYKKISGGGILMDQGIHMLDLMKYLSEEIFTESKSFIETSFWNIELEDNAFAILKSQNNVLASLHSSATQWKHKFLLEICLEEGFINLDGILSTTMSYAPEKLIFGKREFEDITYAMGKPRETTVYFENDDSFKMEVEEFINTIEGKTQITHGTFRDAYEALDLVEKIYANK